MLHVGALVDRAPGRKYINALRFAELALSAPLPKPGTLAKLRAQLPPEFVVALRAPRSAVSSARGPLRIDAELEASLEWLKAAADALQARAVVLHTPAQLTPGARSRDLLREYIGKLPRPAGRHYVWAAQGAWEPEELQRICDELGLTRAFDPLETAAIRSPIAYATLRALGHRSGFSYTALSDAVARTLEHEPEEAFISVDAARSFDVARRLHTLATQTDTSLADFPISPARNAAGAVFEDSDDEGDFGFEDDAKEEDEDADDLLSDDAEEDDAS